jgi:hypothetical protein
LFTEIECDIIKPGHSEKNISEAVGILANERYGLDKKLGYWHGAHRAMWT